MANVNEGSVEIFDTMKFRGSIGLLTRKIQASEISLADSEIELERLNQEYIKQQKFIDERSSEAIMHDLGYVKSLIDGLKTRLSQAS